MVRFYFQFRPEGFIMYKDQGRKEVADTIGYESITSATSPSSSQLWIKTNNNVFVLVFKEGSGINIDWQKSLLVLKDKENENKENVKEVDITYLFQPMKLRYLKSWYSFNYKEFAIQKDIKMVP